MRKKTHEESSVETTPGFHFDQWYPVLIPAGGSGQGSSARPHAPTMAQDSAASENASIEPGPNVMSA